MHDTLIPDPVVAREFHTTLMSIWRWDHDPAKAELGWPAKIKMGRRNYRSRIALEAFKQNLIKRALAERNAAAVSA
jgi:hypothetical protein